MGNNWYCNIGDISNYVTVKSKKLIMIIGSIKENTTIEKRVSITPESAKNIIGLTKSCVEKGYALHLGIMIVNIKILELSLKHHPKKY